MSLRLCQEHNVATSDPAFAARLKRELERVTEERDILKKAALYFAKEPK